MDKDPEVFSRISDYVLKNVEGNSKELLSKLDRSPHSSYDRSEDVRVVNIFCEELLAVGRIVEAGDVLGMLLKAGYKNGITYYNFASYCIKSEQSHVAEKCWINSLAFDDAPAYQVHGNLGAFYKTAGDTYRAISHLQKSLELNPGYELARYNYGLTLIDIEQYEKSLQQFKKLEKAGYKKQNLPINIGLCFLRLDKREKADRYLKKALKGKKDKDLAYFNMGNLKQALGQDAAAIKNYRAAINLRYDFPEAHSALSLSYIAVNRHNDAIDSAVKAVTLDVNLETSWINLSYLLKVMALDDDTLLTLFVNLKDQMADNSELLKYQQCIADVFITGKYSLPSFNKLVKKMKGLYTVPHVEGNLVPTPHEQKKVIALRHFGRSGTGLLHSLVDNHRSMTTLPSIYLSQFFSEKTWNQIYSPQPQKIAEELVKLYPSLFDATRKCSIQSTGNSKIHNLAEEEGLKALGPDNATPLFVDSDKFSVAFCEYLGTGDKINPSTVFEAFNAAYNKSANDQEITEKIFYHIHNPDTGALAGFVASYPEARLLTIVRQPIQSCESWSKFVFKPATYSRVVSRIVSMISEITHPVHQVSSSYSIRLEDLKNEPTATLKRLSEWMNIEFDTSMLEMTVMGQKWWGDPTSPNYKIDGSDPFGKRVINQKEGQVFSEKDIFILNTLFNPFNRSVGYSFLDDETFIKNLLEVEKMILEPMDFERKLQEMDGGKKTIFDSLEFNYRKSAMKRHCEIIKEDSSLNQRIRSI